MTVVTGVNESAKSSWHAAVYAAVTGRRRGRGAPTREERRFAELHKPWDDDHWRVSAVLALDDGRRIELTHDLDGKVDCRAIDLAFGTDVSAAIMFEGSPDASRYLGLDRKSFAATAVVSQADLLGVLSAADGLQEHLQRAAATAGTDATAAAALATLDKFFRENVGLDRSNSSKPLRAAKKALELAETDLSAALAAHDHYLKLSEEAEAHRAAADTAAQQTLAAQRTVTALEELVRAVRVVAERQGEADRAASAGEASATQRDALARRVAKAQTLSAATTGATIPRGGPAAEAVARTVAAALAHWSAAPALRTPAGPTAIDLTAQLDALPQPPNGDTQVAATVRDAEQARIRATAVVTAHDGRRPRDPGAPFGDLAPAVEAGASMLRQLAAQLAATEGHDPASVQDLTDALDEARFKQAVAQTAVADTIVQANAARAAHSAAMSVTPSARATRSGGPRTALLAAAATAAIAAVAAAIVLSNATVALVLGVLSIAAGVGGFLAARPAPGHSPSPAVDVPALSTEASAAEQAVASAQERLYAAVGEVASVDARLRTALMSSSAAAEIAARCAARSLPADPGELQQLVTRAEQHLDAQETYARWASESQQEATTLERAQGALLRVLADRNVAVEATTAQEAFAAYERSCAQRAEQAARAARRREVERALATRLTADRDAARAVAQRESALDSLRWAVATAGVDVGVDTDTGPEIMCDALTQWQTGFDAMLLETDARQRDLSQLDVVLDGSTLAELESSLVSAAERVGDADAAADAARFALQDAVAHARKSADAAGVPHAAVGPSPDAAVKSLARAEEDRAAARDEEMRLARVAENAAGVAAERGRSLRSVPEAEEHMVSAETEVARVIELAETLHLTGSFLTDAQEQIHRTIAPVLTDTLRAWLPQVTAGRYTDATVNPATLEVKVCGPQRKWRHADRLSIGTAEQVYLLLRVALAQHLSTTGESCPLLLDDVTVQADAERTVNILDLLLALSADRQVVVFAQAPGVAEWAREHLGDARHSNLEIPRVIVE
jgi:hypothetical protein